MMTTTIADGIWNVPNPKTGELCGIAIIVKDGLGCGARWNAARDIWLPSILGFKSMTDEQVAYLLASGLAEVQKSA